MHFSYLDSNGFWRWAISIAVSAAAGLIGVLVGAWLTNRQLRRQRKSAFIENQLKQFYSPLLGIRNEIKWLAHLRVKISGEGTAAWQELCRKAEERGPDAVIKMEDEKWKKFERMIDYDNKKFVEDMLPQYHRMVDVFKEYYYLAEKETSEHFQVLIGFVDIWDRWEADALPGEVLERLEYEEKSLYPLYDDIQKKHDELRSKLAAAAACGVLDQGGL